MKNRKNYEKLAMQVYELKQRPQLLVGSETPNPGDNWSWE